jgi:hypothetical protein
MTTKKLRVTVRQRSKELFVTLINIIFGFNVAFITPQFVWQGELYDASPVLPIVYGALLMVLAIALFAASLLSRFPCALLALPVTIHASSFLVYGALNWYPAITPSMCIYAMLLIYVSQAAKDTDCG